jgi:hypothetical protein
MKTFRNPIVGFLFVATIALILTNFKSPRRSHAQFSPPQAVEYVQLQPYKTLAPGQSTYVKVGTIGTTELMPCIAATKVWSADATAQVELHSYCRIQADGYAAVSFVNEGQHTIAVYDRVRVIVQK